jgi:hypothetical protein
MFSNYNKAFDYAFEHVLVASHSHPANPTQKMNGTTASQSRRIEENG